MANVKLQLTFNNETEAAFTFYKSVFGTEYSWPLSRFGEAPPDPDNQLSDEEKNLIVHVELPILGDFVLMGSDAPERIHGRIQKGTNLHISLHPDTRTKTDSLFAALSDEGVVGMPLQEMFWGDYYGMCTDRFGISWVFNCVSKV